MLKRSSSMLRLGVMLRFAAALRLGSVAVAASAWAFAPTALAQAPAEDALKRIIEEGNPAYVDWSGASGDREQIGKLYEANGYRLFCSDGQKPTASAISLLQQLRFAGERGFDPEDYPGNRLASLLTDLIDPPHSLLDHCPLFTSPFPPPHPHAHACSGRGSQRCRRAEGGLPRRTTAESAPPRAPS